MNIEKLNNGRIILLQGDCLHEMVRIKPNSIDMVFADLPYGTTQNKWDTLIDLIGFWHLINNITKLTTPIVCTAATPFDKVLGVSNIENLKYEWIWKKQQGTGHLNAKRQPMRDHENILVFYRQECLYNPQMGIGKPYATWFSEVQTSTSYGHQLSGKDANLGTRYPTTNSLFFKNNSGHNGKSHATSKPIELLEYLIRTYTNPGDTVLDPTMGSGTTGVACAKLNRRFIGIELDENYFNISVKRIQQALDTRDANPPQIPASSD